MNVSIRVDATPRIGTGHLMRCLTLAEALSAGGASVTFLCRELPPHLDERVARAGHRLFRLDSASDDAAQTRTLLEKSPGVDWLIVDHYGLDARWETAVRPAIQRILVIDDLADRPHDCDALLDSAFGENGARYRGLIPAACRGLFGPAYVLLRPQFAAARRRGPALPLCGERVVHVFFGGSDVRGCTSRFARALARHRPRLRQEIAVGALYPDVPGLEGLRRDFPQVRWEREISDMAAHMSRCSVALGAPGTATWERACLGLPSAYLATNPNQRPLLRALEEKGFCRFLGDVDAITDDEFTAGIDDFLSDTPALTRMRELGMAAIDGDGAARVARVLAVG